MDSEVERQELEDDEVTECERKVARLELQEVQKEHTHRPALKTRQLTSRK